MVDVLIKRLPWLSLMFLVEARDEYMDTQNKEHAGQTFRLFYMISRNKFGVFRVGVEDYCSTHGHMIICVMGTPVTWYLTRKAGYCAFIQFNCSWESYSRSDSPEVLDTISSKDHAEPSYYLPILMQLSLRAPPCY